MIITVSIVEEDKPTRDCLWNLINRAENFHCLSQHATAEEAIENVPGHNPAVVLMDVNLPGINGVEAVQRLKPLLPGTRFIMSTSVRNSAQIFSAIKAGANGYLLKPTPPEQLLAALREVGGAGAPLSRQLAGKILDVFHLPSLNATHSEELSQREQEVLELLAQGCLYKEIAQTLDISYRTVATHVEHIYKKLRMRSRTEAVAKYLRKQCHPTDGRFGLVRANAGRH